MKHPSGEALKRAHKSLDRLVELFGDSTKRSGTWLYYGRVKLAHVGQVEKVTGPYQKVVTDRLTLVTDAGTTKRFTELKRTGEFNWDKIVEWIGVIVAEEKREEEQREADQRSYQEAKRITKKVKEDGLLDLGHIFVFRAHPGRPDHEGIRHITLELSIDTDWFETAMKALKDAMADE